MGQGQSRNLFEAAASDELERAKYFIEHDQTDVNARDKDGWTPLHFASYGGSSKVTEELLRLGADPTVSDKGGRTPLHLAALQGHTGLVKLLEAAGADVRAKDEHGMTPLHKAAVQGHRETAAELLAHGAHVDAKLTDGSTALHLAAWKGKLDTVKLLIDRGANFRAVKNDGQTALHESAEAGQKDVVLYLLSIGANAQAQDEDGATPATLASKAGHGDLAALIASGGNAVGHRRPAPSSVTHLDPVFYSLEQLQARETGAAAPSAPPMPSAPPAGTSHAAPPGMSSQPDSHVWRRAVQTPLDADRAQGPVSYPQVYQPGQGNSEWWAKNVGRDLSEKYPVQPQPPAMPEQWKKKQEEAHGHTQPANPRKEFEENVLKQAQGLWRMLQGKPKDEAAARTKAEREAQEDAQAEAEWAGAGANTGWDVKPERQPPHTEKYDLKPYEPEDDDEYRTDEEKAAKEPHGAKGGAAASQLRRKLAELELEVDRNQGWVRGGTKADAKNYAKQREKMQEQEAQIRALRQQLEFMQVAASRASAGRGSGMRQMDGNVPAEYICPITQEMMTEPVVAADGYSYERSAILQWLQLGHTTSPMTNQPLEHPGLTSNRGLRSAIQQWKSTH